MVCSFGIKLVIGVLVVWIRIVFFVVIEMVNGFFCLSGNGFVVVFGNLIGILIVNKGVVIMKMIKSISIMFIKGVMLILVIGWFWVC